MTLTMLLIQSQMSQVLSYEHNHNSFLAQHNGGGGGDVDASKSDSGSTPGSQTMTLHTPITMQELHTYCRPSRADDGGIRRLEHDSRGVSGCLGMPTRRAFH